MSAALPSPLEERGIKRRRQEGKIKEEGKREVANEVDKKKKGRKEGRKGDRRRDRSKESRT